MKIEALDPGQIFEDLEVNGNPLRSVISKSLNSSNLMDLVCFYSTDELEEIWSADQLVEEHGISAEKVQVIEENFIDHENDMTWGALTLWKLNGVLFVSTQNASPMDFYTTKANLTSFLSTL